MVGVLVGARPGTVTTGDWIAWSQTNDATGRVCRACQFVCVSGVFIGRG